MQKVFHITRSTAIGAAVVAQWVRAFTPQGEGWVFEPHPQQV